MKSGFRIGTIAVVGLFTAYLYVLFIIILFKFGTPNLPFLWEQLQRLPERSFLREFTYLYNVVPFRSVLDTLLYPSIHGWINLFGNIALFVPLGLFLGYLVRGLSWSGAVLASFGLSLLLEVLQLVFFIGTFDTDDLILNTLGGAVGFALYKWIAPTAGQNETRRRHVQARVENR
ncbi:VanZ family protein [Paenibacillus sp. NPDC058071]|uniref:VanZ family protein n=1 Tax=Paenibacillus sp. NPDC058071 TaxID=3346326 RepID=UPI0036DC288C